MPQTVLVQADGEIVDYELHWPFRECRLASMTTAPGERGITCQKQMDPESPRYLRQLTGGKPTAVQTALEAFARGPTRPIRSSPCTGTTGCETGGASSLLAGRPDEIRQVFEGFGHGCLAAGTNIGVFHSALLSLRWGAKSQTPSDLAVSRRGGRMVGAQTQL